MWDLHRGVNITDASNKELIMPILNYYAEGFISYPLMRACVYIGVMVSSETRITLARQLTIMHVMQVNMIHSWIGVRAMGRGIGCFRTSYHYNQTIWNYEAKRTGRICAITVR